MDTLDTIKDELVKIEIAKDRLGKLISECRDLESSVYDTRWSFMSLLSKLEEKSKTLTATLVNLIMKG